MTFIAAPGVAQLRFAGKIGGNSWACILHWNAGVAAPWTQSQVDSLATTAHSAYNTNLTPLFTNQVVLNEIQAVDLSDQVQRENTIEGLTEVGGQTGVAPTLAACLMINLHIGARYRGGHPRVYWPPGPNTDTSDADTWQAGTVTAMDNAFGSFQSAIRTALVSAGLANNGLCAPRYSYQYVDNTAKKRYDKVRQSFLGPFPVSSWNTSNQIRTQRRRLGK